MHQQNEKMTWSLCLNQIWEELNQTYVVGILALGIKNTNVILDGNTWESKSQETMQRP